MAGLISHRHMSDLSVATVLQQASCVFTGAAIFDAQAETICQQFTTWINEDLDNLMTG